MEIAPLNYAQVYALYLYLQIQALDSVFPYAPLDYIQIAILKAVLLLLHAILIQLETLHQINAYPIQVTHLIFRLPYSSLYVC